MKPYSARNKIKADLAGNVYYSIELQIGQILVAFLLKAFFVLFLLQTLNYFIRFNPNCFVSEVPSNLY